MKATVARILFAAALIGAAYGIRAPALDRDVWNLDEGSTLTMGQQVLEGDVLYRDAADNRAPLVPFLKAAIFAVAGDWNGYAVHVFLALMLGGIAVLIWLVAHLLGNERAGIGGAIFFTALAFVLPVYLDTMTTHTGWFVVLFSTLGYVVFAARAPAGGGFGSGATAGLMFGLSALCKQPGLLDLGVTWVLAGLLAWQQPLQRTRLLRFVAGQLTAVLAAFALVFLYFYAHGALRDFVFYAWTYNTHYYIPEVPLAKRLAVVRMPFLLAWHHLPIALVAGVAAAVLLIFGAIRSLVRRHVQETLFVWLVLGWTAAGLVSTMLSGREFSHYSLQAVPGLSLACGWLGARLWEAAWRPRLARRATVPIVAVAFVAALASMGQAIIERQHSLDPREDIGEPVGETVRQITRSDERIFVWGYMPELYYFSQRLPSSRFIYTNFVTGMIPWTNVDPLRDTAYASVPGSWETMWTDLQANPPAVIIDTGTLRRYAKYPFARQDRLWRYARAHYVAIDAPSARTHGFQLYRRLDDVAPATLEGDLPADPQIALNGRSLTGGALEVSTVVLRVPAHSTGVELYRNGRLYQRLSHPLPTGGEVTFFVDGDDSERATAEFRALVRQGERVSFSNPHYMANYTSPDYLDPGKAAAGPVMGFSHRFVAPLEASTAGRPADATEWQRSWTGVLPARFVYPRLRNMSALMFDVSLVPEADGERSPATVSISFAQRDGRTENLHQEELTPGDAETVRVVLPGADPGNLVVEIAPASLSVGPANRLTIENVRGQGIGPDLIMDDGRVLVPETSESVFPGQLQSGDGDHWPAHAPTTVTYFVPPDLRTVTVRFGLHDDAYLDKNGTPRGDGVGLVALFEDPAGGKTALLRRMLTPSSRLEDRGPQTAEISLPEVHQGGRLHVEITTGFGPDSSFDWSYFLNFTGTTAPRGRPRDNRPTTINAPPL